MHKKTINSQLRNIKIIIQFHKPYEYNTKSNCFACCIHFINNSESFGKGYRKYFKQIERTFAIIREVLPSNFSGDF